MKVYEGERAPEGCKVTVDGKPLDPRFDLRNHSPTGFSHGYAGSGPAQLSLALLADALGDDEQAQDLYQKFKFKVIAGIEGDRWQLTESEIRARVAEILAEKQKREETSE